MIWGWADFDFDLGLGVKFDGRVPGVYLVGLVCIWCVFDGNWRELAGIGGNWGEIEISLV
jgi:hypothetical protein